MMMGKYLDKAEVDRLAELTRLKVDMKRALDPKLAEEFPGFQVAFDALSEGADIFVDPLSDESIAGYALQLDIKGSPGLLWQAEVPKDIMDEGNKSLNFMLIALIVIRCGVGGRYRLFTGQTGPVSHVPS